MQEKITEREFAENYCRKMTFSMKSLPSDKSRISKIYKSEIFKLLSEQMVH